MRISPTDLILNPDGSIYHLCLRPENVADTIITVGDPDRVEKVSQYFDSVEFRINKREFVTHTGTLGGKRLTVISSGIGTDNVEILMNELDALVNIDLETFEAKPYHKSLNIIRLGTSGSLQKHIPVDSFVISRKAVGLDNLGAFYPSTAMPINSALKRSLNLNFLPYSLSATIKLYNVFWKKAPQNWFEGTTVTCPGFYAPQGRVLRYNPKIDGLLDKMNNFQFDGINLTNLEMETAGYYLLGKILGHEVLSVSAILANRMTNEFSKQPEKQVDNLIKCALEKIVSI
ncbi:MAG: nucleoside phosphorylase [Arcicella sp.]|nr:nucleoside phosphorylase [Arcicella sp.]